MIFRGNVWKFGSDVDTDVIIPTKYLNITDPWELGQHCMEGIDPNFSQKVKQGDIIMAEKNFGCGSSREHAPLAIKGVGISCVIARTFARIFYRNAFNIGLPIFECIEDLSNLEEGQEVEIHVNTGQIRDLFKGRTFQTKPIPTFMQELVRDGGLMNHLAKRLIQ